MSKYEWERGTITLPASEWSKFRTEMIKEWNRIQNRLFEEAMTALNTLKMNNKGKRNVNWGEKINEYICAGHIIGLGADGDSIIRDLILAPDNSKLLTPKKKSLKILPLSKDANVSMGEAGIRLVNASRSVYYNVRENNHACECARSEPMTRKMFWLLGEVKWTRTTGGTIYGNDEYNRESGEDCEGEGGSYAKERYGKDSKQTILRRF